MKNHFIKSIVYRNWQLLLYITFFVFLILPAPNFAKSSIAVLPFKASGISMKDAYILTDRLRADLVRSKHYQVVEREKMEEIFKEQNFQLSGCTSDECVIKAGKILGVQQIIAGNIGKIGQTFTVSARLIEVETGEIIQATSYDQTGKIDDLLSQGMLRVASQITGEEASSIQEESVANTSKQATKKHKIFALKIPHLKSHFPVNIGYETPLLPWMNNGMGHIIWIGKNNQNKYEGSIKFKLQYVRFNAPELYLRDGVTSQSVEIYGVNIQVSQWGDYTGWFFETGLQYWAGGVGFSTWKKSRNYQQIKIPIIGGYEFDVLDTIYFNIFGGAYFLVFGDFKIEPVKFDFIVPVITISGGIKLLPI